MLKTNPTQRMTTSTAASPTPSTTASSNDGFAWEVQEFIAERTSITTGDNEILVVWKTSWMPLSSLIADSPAWRRWKDAQKWQSCHCGDCHSHNALMQVTLPVEDGSVMAADLAEGYASNARTYLRMERAAAARCRRADDGPWAKANRCEAGSSEERIRANIAAEFTMETQPRSPTNA